MNRIYRREPLDGSLLLSFRMSFRSSPRERRRSAAFQILFKLSQIAVWLWFDRGLIAVV